MNSQTFSRKIIVTNTRPADVCTLSLSPFLSLSPPLPLLLPCPQTFSHKIIVTNTHGLLMYALFLYIPSSFSLPSFSFSLSLPLLPSLPLPPSPFLSLPLSLTLGQADVIVIEQYPRSADPQIRVRLIEPNAEVSFSLLSLPFFFPFRLLFVSFLSPLVCFCWLLFVLIKIFADIFVNIFIFFFSSSLLSSFLLFFFSSFLLFFFSSFLLFFFCCFRRDPTTQ